MASSLLSHDEVADLGMFLGELDELCLTIDHPISLSLGNCLITIGRVAGNYHVIDMGPKKTDAS